MRPRYRSGRNLRSHPAKLRIVWRPFESEIIRSRELRLINDRSVQYGCLHQCSEVGHSCVSNVQISEIMEEQSRKPVRITLALGHFRAALGYTEDIDREFFLVAVETELEAIGEQFLDHDLPLFIAGGTFSVGFRVYVEFIGRRPSRGTNDLLGVNAICERDEIIQSRIDSLELTTSNAEHFAWRIWFARFDSRDLEAW